MRWLAPLVVVAVLVAGAAAASAAAAAEHVVRPTPETTHFGGWSAEYPPVVEVASGDVVHLWTVSGKPAQIPMDKFDVPEELQAIWRAQCGAADGSQPATAPGVTPAKFCGAPGPHVMTGPVAVVRRCRLTLSNPTLKELMVSVHETRTSS